VDVSATPSVLPSPSPTRSPALPLEDVDVRHGARFAASRRQGTEEVEEVDTEAWSKAFNDGQKRKMFRLTRGSHLVRDPANPTIVREFDQGAELPLTLDQYHSFSDKFAPVDEDMSSGWVTAPVSNPGVTLPPGTRVLPPSA
jgi:hypothetical protein